MNNLLVFWFSLSFSGSLVALTLIMLKPVLQQFSKTWQYYLWLLVILRLLIPFTPDVSIVGGLFQQIGTQLEEQNKITDPTPAINFSEDTSPQAKPIFSNNSPSEKPAAVDIFSLLKNNGWGALWLGIATILLIRKTVGYERFLKTVKKENKIIVDGQLPLDLQTISKAMGIKRTIPICANSFVQAPMLIGFIKPMIILPNESIPHPELLLILRHELTHYQRLDFLYKWLAEITVCLHWFNPLIYLVRKKISQDCEFSCDETVVSHLESSERQIYGETLLNAIIINNSVHAAPVSLSLNRDVKIIKERLNAIMSYRRKSKLIVLTAVVLTSILLCGTVYAGAYKAETVENASNNQSAQNNGNSIQSDKKNTQTIVYEDVNLHHKDGDEKFEYITNVRTNNTDKKIISCDRAMLAFDIEGNPVKLDWWTKDGDLNYHYLWRHGGLTREVLPGQKDEQTGGWKLNAQADPQVQKVAFVLFCDISITFEDGTVWENPEYEKWLLTYEGQKTDVDVLENYYPYQEEIIITK